MPAVERPDGVEIHWEEHGQETPVLIAHQFLWSYPGVYEDLIGDLARDHRVVTIDARGCGASTRRGPYDPETDAADLLAVAEAAGGTAVALAVGYGYNVAARVASARPDVISDVIAAQPAAAAVLPQSELKGSGVMAASDSVIELLMKMMRSEPRAAIHTLLATVNPELGQHQLRERVARVSSYISPEAMLDRTQAWLKDDPGAHTLALGGRLWILHGETEPIYEGTLTARVAELYPDAQVEQVSRGPISRPDLYASWIRRLTGARAASG